MAIVYKLTRSDGLEYIGVTKNLRKRLNSHKNSKRFSEKTIVQVQVLFDGDYVECEALEEKFIEQYGTYTNGLNLTAKGKGKSETCRFNTLGYKFSDESRKRMSESSKARTDRPKGYRHTAETKAKWSERRRGKVWGPVKIDKDKLISEWHAFSPTLEDMKHMVLSVSEDGDVRFKNGKKFSYTRGKLVLFKKAKSIEYNTTPEAIKRIITDEQLL